MPPHDSTTSPPVLLSVVVPCRNEEGHIEAALASLLDQQRPEGDYEVLVADGRSEDRTRELVATVARRDPRVRLIDNPGKTAPCAMNAGIRAARGEIVLRADAHTEYASDYLRASVRALIATGADNVGGAMRTRAEGLWQRANAAAFHSPFSTGGGRFHREDYEGEVDTVPYGCWWKSRLVSLGLFDERFTRNQDDELNLRTRLNGGRVWQSRSIRSWHRPRASLGRLFRQYVQYGYFKVLVIKKHRRPASWRHLVPVLFFLGLVLGPIAAALSPVALAAVLGAAGVYGVLSLGFSAAAARRAGWDLLPIVPVVFFVYHTAYGYGFARGSVDFLLLSRGPSTGMEAPPESMTPDAPGSASVSDRRAA